MPFHLELDMYTMSDDDEEDDYFHDEPPFSEDDDQWDDDDLLMDNEDVFIDMEGVFESANRKVKYHFACTLGPTTGDGLMLEAELNLAVHDYSAALVCAIAYDLAKKRESLSRKAIEMICLYQMGDRGSAITIMNKFERIIIDSDHVTVGLRNKFASTCEVLKFMPQLLDMIGQMKSR